MRKKKSQRGSFLANCRAPICSPQSCSSRAVYQTELPHGSAQGAPTECGHRGRRVTPKGLGISPKVFGRCVFSGSKWFGRFAQRVWAQTLWAHGCAGQSKPFGRTGARVNPNPLGARARWSIQTLWAHGSQASQSIMSGFFASSFFTATTATSFLTIFW